VSYVAPKADATHEPANKAAAAGSDIDEVSDDKAILSDTFRVSTQEDMIVNVTSECSILTSLLTEGGPNTSEVSSKVFGQVELYVTLDGKIVPVSVNDVNGPDAPGGDSDGEEAQDDPQEQGEVVFCNRAYQRSIQDTEENEGPATGGNQDGDGTDTESDYLRTRTANAFNWLATDIGFAYDDACAGYDPQAAPAQEGFDGCVYSVSNGNNIIEAKLWAEYESTKNGVQDDPATEDVDESRCPTAAYTEETCSEAFVGSRTMILEPVKVSIHEEVQDQGGAGH
jgi:hypothetical protein